MTTSKTRKSTSETERPSSDAPRKEGSATKSRAASPPRAAAKKKPSTSQIAASAALQLLELTGRTSEGITGVERTDDGWKIEVEVVEVRRIPDTTDMLALYEVQVDETGTLEGYRRVRRYVRGTAQEN